METFDMKAEMPIPLAEAAALLPGRKGRKLSIRTIERWIRHGHKGVHLQCVVLGRLLFTSQESLQRFSERCMQVMAGDKLSPLNRTPSVARRSHERAKRTLEKAGFGKRSQPVPAGSAAADEGVPHEST